MTRSEQVAALLAMRCEGCKRRPHTAWTVEMLASFGHKLKGGDKLVWFCPQCVAKRGKA